MNAQPQPTAREVSHNCLVALDIAARAAQRLTAMGITGIRLVGHDRGIPLIQIDPPTVPDEFVAMPYYRYESPDAIRTTYLGAYAGAVVIWATEQLKPTRRLH